MSKSLKYLTITLAVYIIYSLQGILYPSGTFLTQTILLLFLLIGVYGFFKTLFQNKSNPRFVQYLSIFFFLLTITFIVSPKEVYGNAYEFSGLMTTLGQYKNICFVILSFFAVYYFSRKNKISNKYLYYLGVILVAVAIMRYFYSIKMLQQEFGFDDVQNNAAYCIVAIIPFMPFVFKKYKFFAPMISLILIALILNAAKRGAIICLIVSLVFSALYFLRRSRISFFKRILLISMVVAVGFFMVNISLQNDFLMDRIEMTREGNIGTREVAYTMMWQHWIHSDNVFTMLFGNGMLQSVNVWGNSAHNDWLELLTDNGLLGVLIYISFFIYLFSYISRMKGETSLQIGAYLAGVILLTKTFFSMGYTDFVNVPLFLAFGLYIGKYEFRNIIRNG